MGRTLYTLLRLHLCFLEVSQQSIRQEFLKLPHVVIRILGALLFHIHEVRYT